MEINNSRRERARRKVIDRKFGGGIMKEIEGIEEGYRLKLRMREKEIERLDDTWGKDERQ